MKKAGMALALLLAIQFVIFETAVLTKSRFTGVPGGVAIVALIGALAYLPALWFLTLGRDVRRPRLKGVAIALAVLVGVRYHLPAFVNWVNRAELASEVSPAAVALLREVSSAQEQYRLISGTYATSPDSLRRWISPPEGSTLSLTTRGNAGWSARANVAGAECEMWVRDTTLRKHEWEPEGSPYCGKERRPRHQSVRSLIVPVSAETPFTARDLGGEWNQHRADEQRSGRVVTYANGNGSHVSAPIRWTMKVGGELRASVAVAGNQVVVGAHGNGELVALTLDSGQLGFRLRTPNWVHHEPVISADLIVIGFGNSERLYKQGPETGSAPSGVVAYDRRTGAERWRRYTSGSVMTTPVLRDSIVAVVTHTSDAIAWRLRDGQELWRTRLSGPSAMSNPLLIDTTMVIGVGAIGFCALNVLTGAKTFCNQLPDRGWGAGHASPTVAGNLILQVFEGISSHPEPVSKRWHKLAMSWVGIPDPEGYARQWHEAGEQVLIASDLATGAERWRTKLGIADREAIGHIAGTPTVVDSIAYVPSPNNGSVIALNVADGKILWSTPINSARGSVLVTGGALLAASIDGKFYVLDANTGQVRCQQKLPGTSDRAGPTLAGSTAIYSLRNGMVMARPLSDWLACRA